MRAAAFTKSVKGAFFSKVGKEIKDRDTLPSDTRCGESFLRTIARVGTNKGESRYVDIKASVSAQPPDSPEAQG